MTHPLERIKPERQKYYFYALLALTLVMLLCMQFYCML